MADQLLGVLREVAAVESGTPRPAPSNLFGPDMLALDHDGGIEPQQPSYLHLPVPAMDPSDPAMRAISVAGSVFDPARRVAALRSAQEQWPKSREAKFRLAGGLTDAAGYAGASKLLDEASSEDAWDWRVPWYRGRNFLAQGQAAEAQAQFEQVYFDLPGELAPKAALALAAEMAGALPTAGRLYDLVTRTDPNYISCAFGLARVRVASGDRLGALDALARVPETSGMFVHARVEAARFLIHRTPVAPGPGEFAQAGEQIEKLALDAVDRLALSRQVLSTALHMISTGALKPSPAVKVLGYPLEEIGLRVALEKCLRETAHLAVGADKIPLVDAANHIRPRTLF
jgi:serine/threonine-protein kinase PknG